MKWNCGVNVKRKCSEGDGVIGEGSSHFVEGIKVCGDKRGKSDELGGKKVWR